MANNIDLSIDKNGDNYYDISFGSDGDFNLNANMDTAILMSIFCEKRASSSEVADPLKRRGWIGNVFNNDGFEIGSKFWLYEQSRLTNDTINGIQDAILKGNQWMIDDNILTDVQISTTNNASKGEIKANVKYIFSSGRVTQKFYDLWLNTGL